MTNLEFMLSFPPTCKRVKKQRIVITKHDSRQKGNIDTKKFRHSLADIGLVEPRFQTSMCFISLWHLFFIIIFFNLPTFINVLKHVTTYSMTFSRTKPMKETKLSCLELGNLSSCRFNPSLLVNRQLSLYEGFKIT